MDIGATSRPNVNTALFGGTMLMGPEPTAFAHEMQAAHAIQAAEPWPCRSARAIFTGYQNRVPVTQIRTDERGQLDLSASYEFEWLPTSPRLTFDVINITDEPQRSTFEYPNATFTYYEPGTTYLIGVRGAF